jgi:hypothetical protein
MQGSFKQPLGLLGVPQREECVRSAPAEIAIVVGLVSQLARDAHHAMLTKLRT